MSLALDSGPHHHDPATMGSLAELEGPYWHVNVPAEKRTDECPVYLHGLSDKDRGIIATPEHLFQRDTWDEAKQKVDDKRFDLFKRTPSELRRYREFTWRLRQEPDGILNFILAHRLHWPQPIVARGRPFECDDDIKVLWNDWPYAVDTRIVHLVVWVKFELDEDPATGLVTEATSAAISRYVRKTFSQVPEERVSHAVVSNCRFLGVLTGRR